MTDTPVEVPPDRNLGDPGHINDHNLLSAGIEALDSKLASKLAAADQTIIQIVRATDSTDRTTTSDRSALVPRADPALSSHSSTVWSTM